MNKYHLSLNKKYIIVIGERWDMVKEERYNCQQIEISTGIRHPNSRRSIIPSQLVEGHYSPISDNEGDLLTL
jgi:hypothetical protein